MIQDEPGDRSKSRENDKRSNKQLKMDSRSSNLGDPTEDTVQLLYQNS